MVDTPRGGGTVTIPARRPNRPRPSWRWVAPFGFRLWEYRERNAGPCRFCRLPTSWIWAGSAEDWCTAQRVRREHHVPLAFALGVRGVGRDGRVLCATCRAAGVPA